MDNLKKEYTDIKGVRHKVEHLTVSDNDDISRERIIEELFQALTRSVRRISA